eukprot:jgi/Tetstr1/422987/TSEL_013764.t1
MWLRLAEGLLSAYDQPQPSEAATYQQAATPADAGVRAWAEYEADTDADDAVICPPTHTLLALLEVREVWNARRSADSVRLELLDPEAARLLLDVCRDAELALPFGDQSQGRTVIQFFRCALTAKAICTGPLVNLELPTVEYLAEAIAATISQRINTPPELQHAQWLMDTMTAARVEMYHHHTEPKLLRVGDDNLCAISLGQEDEDGSEFDPSELLIHPFSQTIRVAGELGGNTGHNQIRRSTLGLPPTDRLVAQDSVDNVREDQGRASSSTNRAAPCRHIASPTTSRPDPTATSSDPNSPYRTPATATTATAAMPGGQADDEEELELNYEENDNAMEVDITQELLAQSSPASQPAIAAELASLAAESHQLRHPQRLSIQLERQPSQPNLVGKGKAATTAKLKKQQPSGRSRSDGATRNRRRSKLRLSGTRDSDGEWVTDDDAARPSSSSHQ